MKWSFGQVNIVGAFGLRTQSLKLDRRSLLVGAMIVCVVAAFVMWQIRLQAQRETEAARALIGKQAFVPFEKRAQTAVSQDGIRLIQNDKDVRGLTQFNESLFAATDGGLVEWSSDGKTKRRYTVLDGLPESDLTCVASFNATLWIGTRSQGLVAFDGQRFERYRWTDRQLQTITALREDRGRLLIGTFAGGLLEFDGRQFREIKAEQMRLIGVNHLVADETRLYVGTFADGLWLNDAGHWFHFTMADGLPSNRIVGVIRSGEQLLVASDFGVASASLAELRGAASAKRFHTIATLPMTSSLLANGDTFLLSKENGELFQISVSANRFQLSPLTWPRPENLLSCQLTTFGQPAEKTLCLLSSEGVWRTSWQGKKFSERLTWQPFGAHESKNQPSSNLISALAFDDIGRLWLGGFRNGIDVFTSEVRKAAHLESDDVREINALVWDETSKQMSAATAQGLVRFDAMLRAQRDETLPSNSISQIITTSAKHSASAMLATNRGVWFGQTNQWRALTTAQGLPGNSVYTVLSHRDSSYAGTLNGLAQIVGGRVVRVFNDANSKLTTNWVTALCAAGPHLFIGTYGGGVFELTAAGEIVGFASEIGKTTVNPNAMLCDGERLYVGTLDGVWVMTLRSQKWEQVKAALPSNTVLSVASDGQRVYFGTTSGLVSMEERLFEEH